jgi:hypothetical protein
VQVQYFEGLIGSGERIDVWSFFQFALNTDFTIFCRLLWIGRYDLVEKEKLTQVFV